MSYQGLHWAYELKALKGPAKPILVALADQADSDATCWPGQQLLADMTGVSTKTVERACQRLERLGLIFRTRRHTTTGYRTSDRFTLLLDVTPEALEESLAAEKGNALTDTPPTRRSAYKAESLQGTQSDLPDTESGQVELRSTDPSETPQIPPKAPQPIVGESTSVPGTAVVVGAKKPRRVDSDLDAADAPDGTRFADFWSAYPRHDDRRRAENAWKSARRRAAPAEIVAGAARYAADPNRTGEFTKQPATWLNADAWANDPLPARNSRPAENTVDRRNRQVEEMRAQLAARQQSPNEVGALTR